MNIYQFVLGMLLYLRGICPPQSHPFRGPGLDADWNPAGERVAGAKHVLAISRVADFWQHDLTQKPVLAWCVDPDEPDIAPNRSSAGLATVLFMLGTPAEIARTILRQADVSVTQEHYILLKSQKEGRVAMKRLGQIVRQKF